MSFSNRLMVIFVPVFKLNGLNAGSSGNMVCTKLMTQRHAREICEIRRQSRWQENMDKSHGEDDRGIQAKM